MYALGFSNGGMILTTMLCKSEFFRSTLSAAALVSTVLKKDYLQTECSQQSLERSVKHKHASEYDSASDHQEQQRRVPLLFIQGLEDSLSPFFLGSTSAAGDVLLSTGEQLLLDWERLEMLAFITGCLSCSLPVVLTP